jgi:rhodanese-related sulfurtransferase
VLIDKGFKLVRPLAGGLDGWAEAGYPVETDTLVAVREAGSSP